MLRSSVYHSLRPLAFAALLLLTLSYAHPTYATRYVKSPLPDEEALTIAVSHAGQALSPAVRRRLEGYKPAQYVYLRGTLELLVHQSVVAPPPWAADDVLGDLPLSAQLYAIDAFKTGLPPDPWLQDFADRFGDVGYYVLADAYGDPDHPDLEGLLLETTGMTHCSTDSCNTIRLRTRLIEGDPAPIIDDLVGRRMPTGNVSMMLCGRPSTQMRAALVAATIAAHETSDLMRRKRTTAILLDYLECTNDGDYDAIPEQWLEELSEIMYQPYVQAFRLRVPPTSTKRHISLTMVYANLIHGVP